VASVKFVVSKQDCDSGVEAGLFSVTYKLRDAPDASAEHRQLLRNALAWFEKHLTTPDRFNRSASKGY